MSALPRIVFISKDIQTTRKMGVTTLMNRLCENDYDVTLISESLGDHHLDYKSDHRLKRLSFDMGVKNRATRAEILAHFVSQMPPSVFVLTDFDREEYLEFPAIIKAQSEAHKVVYFGRPEEVSARLSEKKPLARNRLSEFFEKKIYWRERQRAAKQVPTRMSPEQVRKAQLLASKMLIAFERICQEHGLRYYVAAGSLLGAARHGGPIPWDDDVDVTMPRPDYEKFIKIAQDELPDDMALPRNNFPYGFHRIQMKGTEITRLVRQKGPHGIFLDILPLDGAAPTPRLKKIHGSLNRILLNCMNAKARPLPLITADILRIYEIVKRLIIICFVPKWLMYGLWRRVAAWYDTDAAGEWVCLPGLYGYEKECFPKEYWGEPARLRYEGREVPVMREWEKYLTAHYGDYMTSPPVLERRTHPFIAIDFGKYELMTVQEIEREAEEFKCTKPAAFTR